jgi:hypothetical protein
MLTALLAVALLAPTQSDPVLDALDRVIEHLDREAMFWGGIASDVERNLEGEEFEEVIVSGTRLARNLWRHHDALLAELDGVLMDKAIWLYYSPP